MSADEVSAEGTEMTVAVKLDDVIKDAGIDILQSQFVQELHNNKLDDMTLLAAFSDEVLMQALPGPSSETLRFIRALRKLTGRAGLQRRASLNSGPVVEAPPPGDAREFDHSVALASHDSAW